MQIDVEVVDDEMFNDWSDNFRIGTDGGGELTAVYDRPPVDSMAYMAIATALQMRPVEVPGAGIFQGCRVTQVVQLPPYAQTPDDLARNPSD